MRIVLLLALFLILLCRQIDFITVFLNGALDDVEIYTEQPDYFMMVLIGSASCYKEYMAQDKHPAFVIDCWTSI